MSLQPTNIVVLRAGPNEVKMLDPYVELKPEIQGSMPMSMPMPMPKPVSYKWKNV